MTPIFALATVLLLVVVTLMRGIKYGLLALIVLIGGYVALATWITRVM